MADVTAAMVKELREKSGAGMMDAKNALVENKGNMDEAMDWLLNVEDSLGVAPISRAIAVVSGTAMVANQ